MRYVLKVTKGQENLSICIKKTDLLSCLQGEPIMGITLYVYRLIIIAQTFCGLKKTVLTAIEL